MVASIGAQTSEVLETSEVFGKDDLHAAFLRRSSVARIGRVLSQWFNLAADELHAGAAKIDITPPIGYPMWGYGARHDAASVGVLDPLHARALVLERRRAAHRPGRARSGPGADAAIDRGDSGPGQGGGRHRAPLPGRLAHAPWPGDRAGQLAQGTGPVRPRAGGQAGEGHHRRGQGCHSRRASASPPRKFALNRNRHSKRPDKPVDRELLVLRVEDKAGKPIAHAVNFAAHPTMHPAKVLKFSADYPGAMAKLVEQETGVPCLFLQGAAGDLSPNPPPGVRGPDAVRPGPGQGGPGPEPGRSAASRLTIPGSRRARMIFASAIAST